LGGLIALAAAQAQSPPPAEQSLAQREQLVRKLLSDSASRIGAGASEAARERLAAARQYYQQALVGLQASDFAGAEQNLNAAMTAVAEARRLVAEPQRQHIEQRARYSRLLAWIESLAGSYRRHLARLKGATGDGALEQVEVQVRRAIALAEAGRLEDANELLAGAEKALAEALNQVLGPATLHYANRFDTPAQEFQHEWERNRGYGELVPLALAELKPGPEARDQVQRYVEENRALREQARQAAEDKDFDAALRHIRSATEALQRALRAAGLVMPTEAKAE
jgi:cellobiose-specific phosphotransferase system component IIA